MCVWLFCQVFKIKKGSITSAEEPFFELSLINNIKCRISQAYTTLQTISPCAGKKNLISSFSFCPDWKGYFGGRTKKCPDISSFSNQKLTFTLRVEDSCTEITLASQRIGPFCNFIANTLHLIILTNRMTKETNNFESNNAIIIHINI